MGRFKCFADEASGATDDSFKFITDSPRRTSKERITITEPTENKRENESFGDFRKTLSDRIDPTDLQVSKLTESVDLFLQCKLAVRNDTKGTSCIGKWDVTLSGPLFTLAPLPAKNRLNTIMFDFGE